ncbi:MAG: hypothetical protein HOP08_18230 [Cyclobacteriaceae bacterium]|nr:hypothetical protein [Cyclobacteriaceae bacterium]
MKIYSSETYELIARCLSREGTSEDSGKLMELLSNDPELKTEYELIKLLLLDRCENNSSNSNSKNHFDKLRHRLEEDGLM